MNIHATPDRSRAHHLRFEAVTNTAKFAEYWEFSATLAGQPYTVEVCPEPSDADLADALAAEWRTNRFVEQHAAWVRYELGRGVI